MATTDPLEATLLDLLYELQGSDVPVVLGGGYGLFLRQRQLEASGERLLLNAIPPVRATNDLDVFLRTEILADSTRLKPFREALDRLGFTVIPAAQNYQFARRFTLGGQEWDIKVDLLARAPDPERFPELKFDNRRIKPNPSVGIHAHTTTEAVAIEEQAAPLTLTGIRGNGETFTGTLYIPSAYAFLMMKLYALRDQLQNAEKDYGRKHALDLYALVATLTQSTYAQTQALSTHYQSTPEAMEAGRIVSELFGSPEALGSIRLREHVSFPQQADIRAFLDVLQEFFPTIGA